MVREQVIDALVRARGLVERGWCQGRYEADGQGETRAYCAVGAWLATGEQDVSLTLLVRALRDAGHGHLIEWNDAPERTQADVLALYDAAIALARAEVTP